MAAPSSFLGRLRRDTRGNTLAIMAASLVPLVGFAGSAVDFARIYVVKVRLQQACDAGVLAGRKSMTDTSLTTPLDSTATTQANAFFANNFPVGWYKTTNVTDPSTGAAQPLFAPVKMSDSSTATSANTVQATAQVRLPMAVMTFFGIASRDLQTTCQARYDLADTDVMFVLDTTGSMSCYPSDPDTCATASSTFQHTDGSNAYYNPEKAATTSGGVTTYSKIESVRQAVMLFDSTMRANADSTTHFRYGFVPYSSAVNVGSLIPSTYIQNGTWTYDSRQVVSDYNYGGSYTTSSGGSSKGATSFSLTGVPQYLCVAQRYPATGYSLTGYTWSNSGFYMAMNYYNLSWNGNNGGTCSGMQQPLRAVWRYQPYSLNIGQYVAGNSVADPSRLDGSTSKWRGCIEEVNTTPGATSFSVGSLPDDLNPDFIPSSATDKWRPMWQDVIWARDTSGSQDVQDEQVNESAPDSYTDVSWKYGSYYGALATCGMQSQRLGVMSAQQVHDYVYANDFKPGGGTYHDVGMIWGTRMLSPDGVFGADTAAWPGRNAPSRSIVFMTDGAMAPVPVVYGQYGVENWDLRIDGSSGNIGTNPDYDKAYHNARFHAECDAAKAKGITIYVVAVGTAINSDLTYCASPGQTFQASSTQALTGAFKTIAQRVAMLRITQ